MSDIPAPPSRLDRTLRFLGVDVVFDCDWDDRILEFVRELPPPIRDELSECSERKGSLYLVWKSYIPALYREGYPIQINEDCWVIAESKVHISEMSNSDVPY